MLAIVSAYDLKYIELEDAIERISKTLETIQKLQKWNGHLYNWYNTQTLEPLNPRYVSTVDNGNFIGYLYTVKQFLTNTEKNLKVSVPNTSGYIENNEDPIEAAKRELKEETGYISDDLFLVDEAYTSPGTDNSKTYIVIANNCIKTNEKNITGTELIDYGLFSEKELEYLINKNIINGAMNKLAYYNLINNVDDCNIAYANSNKKIYKKSREKRIR